MNNIEIFSQNVKKKKQVAIKKFDHQIGRLLVHHILLANKSLDNFY